MNETTELKKLTHGLRLLGIHESAESRIAEAARDNTTYEEFLIGLLEDEKLYRKNKTAKMLETKARFRNQAVLEDWDATFDRGLTKTQLRALGELGFVRDKKNLLICGRTGEGKTHLSIALGRKACQTGLKVAFLSVNQFFEESQSERAAGTHMRWISRLKKNDIIVFDDFALRNYTHDEANVLLDLLEDRYQKAMHIITTQVDIGGWHSVFQDRVIAEAIVDRLTHPAERRLIQRKTAGNAPTRGCSKNEKVREGDLKKANLRRYRFGGCKQVPIRWVRSQPIGHKQA